MARKFILDGDYGVDDAMAALYLASESGIQILGVGSVHGNTTSESAARNAITVLDLAGLEEVPVAVGAGRPLVQPLAVRAHVHGGDGLGGVAPVPTGSERPPAPTPAPDQLVELVRAHQGECTVLATGPLTNLALALRLDPAIAGLVERVVIMGGTLHRPGNMGPHTEVNIGLDPEAADLVLTAGWPLTLVGLDVTMSVRLEPADLRRIADHGSPRGRFVWSALQHYLGFYREHHGADGCPLHDPTAARLAVDPGLAAYDDLPVRVDLSPTVNRGMLIAVRQPSAPTAMRIATRVDRDGVVGRFLAGLLGEPLG
jgi:purine nucleosidase